MQGFSPSSPLIKGRGLPAGRFRAMPIPRALRTAHGTNTNRVTTPNAAHLNNASPLTLMVLAKVTTLTGGLGYLAGKKSNAAGAPGWGFRTVTSGSGQLRAGVGRVTAATADSVTGTVQVNRWQWFVMTVDRSHVTLPMRIKTGLLGMPIREVGYASYTVGSGAYSDDAALAFEIGNSPTLNLAVAADIALVMLYPGVLTDWQCTDISRAPWASRDRSWGFWAPGLHFTSGKVIDYSSYAGHGTISGTQLAAPGLLLPGTRTHATWEHPATRNSAAIGYEGVGALAPGGRGYGWQQPTLRGEGLLVGDGRTYGRGFGWSATGTSTLTLDYRAYLRVADWLAVGSSTMTPGGVAVALRAFPRLTGTAVMTAGGMSVEWMTGRTSLERAVRTDRGRLLRSNPTDS